MSATKKVIKILFIGDIVGRPGRRAVEHFIPIIKEEESIDFIFANGENIAAGVGMTLDKYQEGRAIGIDYFTSGNHIWHKEEFIPFLDRDDINVLRPINYPATAPGKGYARIPVGKKHILLVNAIGRVFMKDEVEDPFVALDNLINHYSNDIPIIDFHAEATSEKIALGFYLDGKATALFGTHTHVQTADDRLLPNGTAYVTDVGMCGPINSVLGIKKEIIIEKFLTQLPKSHKVASGESIFNAILVEINTESGRAQSLKRISRVYRPS
ncbi:MAG: hypothetical protein BWY68_00350 [bacterium ADurb.Bin400]|nr:MAG: hypothetical protein BWY68_00350 [bacterium ADurb.Bin400]